jgi:hypothetical protein
VDTVKVLLLLRRASPAIFLLATPCSLCAQTAAEPWTQLFNGKDLTGWKRVGNGDFSVEDGLLRTHARMRLRNWTGGKVGDCVIRVVYRMRDEDDN